MINESDHRSLLGINCQKATANAEFRIQRIGRLDLLQAVDEVIDELVNAQRESEEMLEHFRASLAEYPRYGREPVDPDGKQRECLSVVLDCTRKLITLFEERLQRMRTDPKLSGELKEAVIGEIEACIGIEKELHDTVLQLRWALDENSADFSPETGQFSSVDELAAHLEKL